MQVGDYMATNGWLNNPSLANKDRFVTLARGQTMIAGSSAVASGEAQYQPDNRFIRCNLETMFFDGAGGAIGDIATGSLYLVFFSADAAAATNNFYQWSTRITFVP